MNHLMLRRSTLLSAATFAATATAVFVSRPAEARGFRLRGGMRSAGRKVYTANTMRVNELKQCVRLENQIELLDQGMVFQEADINKAETTLNRYSKKSVSQYNALVDDYNSAGASRSAKVREYNSLCANKSYFADDLATAQAEVAAER